MRGLALDSASDLDLDLAAGCPDGFGRLPAHIRLRRFCFVLSMFPPPFSKHLAPPLSDCAAPAHAQVIEFQATGDNTEAAAAAALELVQSARDNSSCLNTQLRSQFAQVDGAAGVHALYRVLLLPYAFGSQLCYGPGP